MPDDPQIIYWDANNFLSYINEHPDRMPVLEALLENSTTGSIQLYTSEVSRVEVAFALVERQRRALDSQTEELIDSLWADTATITMVEYHSGISSVARGLMRQAVPHDWSLKPLDAIHLATAQWLLNVGIQVEEFHTYDKSLEKYGSLVGFKICEPYTANPRMI